uniref:Uncharacterized protein n=1 Tax=Ornithodoros erraticus TaxID=265619 RepID=A0A293MUU9_ORNER
MCQSSSATVYPSSTRRVICWSRSFSLCSKESSSFWSCVGFWFSALRLPVDLIGDLKDVFMNFDRRARMLRNGVLALLLSILQSYISYITMQKYSILSGSVTRCPFSFAFLNYKATSKQLRLNISFNTERSHEIDKLLPRLIFENEARPTGSSRYHLRRVGSSTTTPIELRGTESKNKNGYVKLLPGCTFPSTTGNLPLGSPLNGSI